MTKLRDYVHNTSGRAVWHGDDDLELQCSQWGFGEAGSALIVAPYNYNLHYSYVEAGAAGRWLTDKETRTLGAGKQTRTTGPSWPNNVRIFEAKLVAPKPGDKEEEGNLYIPGITDAADWLQGVGKDYQWVVWLVAAIIIIIIVFGLYIAAAKATRGG